MATATNTNYYIPADSVTITPNLHDNAYFVGVSVLYGTKIYVDSSKYTFLNSNSWTLNGQDLILNADFGGNAVYIYAALSLSGSNAVIVFSNNNLEDTVTLQAVDEGVTPMYAFVKLGCLSAVVNSQRSLVSFDTGCLKIAGVNGTASYAVEAEHAKTADYATTADSAQTALEATHATSASSADEATHALSADTADEATHAASAADLDPSKQQELDNKYLRKDQDDETTHKLKAKEVEVADGITVGGNATVKGDATIGGDTDITGKLEVADDTTLDSNLEVKGNSITKGNANVKGDATTEGNSITKGNANVKGDATTEGNTTTKGNAKVEGSTNLQTTTFGTPVNAPVSGTTGGAIITNEGDIKAKSIALSEFLEVPELRFNRASIIVGTNIQSPCGGVIKTVTPIDEYTGIATLELGDDDIAGSIATGDLCWGYWHDTSGSYVAKKDEDGNDIIDEEGNTVTEWVKNKNNATADSDDRKGNIQYSGFASVYFHISKVLTSADGDYPNNSTVFQYELKEGTTLHPYIGMHFGGRGSTTDKTRQGFTITTPNYTATYQLVSSWDWSDVSKYIVRVSGLLDGFEALADVTAGTWHNYYGTIDCNLWLRGNPNYVSASKYYMYITQSSNGMLEDGEAESVTIVIRNNWFQNHTSLFSIKVGDNTYSNVEDELSLTFNYSDLTEELTRIPVIATYGTTTLEGNITIRRLAPTNYSMDISIAGDSLLALGETKKVAFRLLTNTGFDVTSQAWKWLIERGSFNTSGEWTQTDADKVWGARQKARAFNQQSYTSNVYIMLTWSDNPTENDLDPDINVSATTFRITATIGDEEIQETIEI